MPWTRSCLRFVLFAALPLSLAAQQLVPGKQPSILDTLARVHATKGEWQQAVAVQKEARALVNDDPKARARLEPALAEYESKQKAKG